jgi:hypothetical protein
MVTCIDLVQYYTPMTFDISWISLVLNFLCILGWSRILWLDNSGSNASRLAAGNVSTGNTFKYLLVKAVCDLLFAADCLYQFSHFDIHSFWGTFYNVVLSNFGIYFLNFMSASMELLATLGERKLLFLFIYNFFESRKTL